MIQLQIDQRETTGMLRESARVADSRLYLYSACELHHIALSSICGAGSGLALIGRESKLPASFEMLLTMRPDLIIIDAALLTNNCLTGREAVLSAIHSISRVIVLAERPDIAFACSVISSGADGYLLTSSPLDEFLQALRIVATGGTWLGSVLTRMLVDKLTGAPVDAARTSRLLSQRERQILNYVAQGKTSKEIAGELYLSESSVRTYWYRVLSKLNALNKAEAITRASRLGLLDTRLEDEEQALQVSPRLQALLHQVTHRVLQD